MDTTNKQIKKIRIALKMTQKQLADLVHIDESMINKKMVIQQAQSEP